MGIHLRTPLSNFLQLLGCLPGSYLSVKGSIGSRTRYDLLSHKPYSPAPQSLHPRLCGKTSIGWFGCSLLDLVRVRKIFRHQDRVGIYGFGGRRPIGLAQLAPSDSKPHVSSRLEGFLGLSASANIPRFGDWQISTNEPLTLRSALLTIRTPFKTAQVGLLCHNLRGKKSLGIRQTNLVSFFAFIDLDLKSFVTL